MFVFGLKPIHNSISRFLFGIWELHSEGQSELLFLNPERVQVFSRHSIHPLCRIWNKVGDYTLRGAYDCCSCGWCPLSRRELIAHDLFETRSHGSSSANPFTSVAASLIKMPTDVLWRAHLRGRGERQRACAHKGKSASHPSLAAAF